jgi:hypothetical protein
MNEMWEFNLKIVELEERFSRLRSDFGNNVAQDSTREERWDVFIERVQTLSDRLDVVEQSTVLFSEFEKELAFAQMLEERVRSLEDRFAESVSSFSSLTQRVCDLEEKQERLVLLPMMSKPSETRVAKSVQAFEEDLPQTSLLEGNEVKDDVEVELDDSEIRQSKLKSETCRTNPASETTWNAYQIEESMWGMPLFCFSACPRTESILIRLGLSSISCCSFGAHISSEQIW